MGYQQPDLPPYYGRSSRKDVNIPQTTPWAIEFVRINERDTELERLSLVAIPNEIIVTPTAEWQSIPSIGRNNHFYNYTGGEDILEFTIDWYAKEDLKHDVIRNCRWLASMAKADAYKKEPDRVILLWGDLFQYTQWIVTAAPYRLSLFDRGNGQLPIQAYQDVQLKKVTNENTSNFDQRSWPQ